MISLLKIRKVHNQVNIVGGFTVRVLCTFSDVAL